MLKAASGRTWLLTLPSGHSGWLDQNGGLHWLGGSGAQASTRSIANSGAAISTVMADSNGCLWIGTAGDGILRVPGDPRAPVQHYTRNDGLSSGFIRSIFEDREHNIWVATEDGLNRFQRNQVLVLTRREGLISNHVNSIAAGVDGSVWLATADGLQRLAGGQTETYRPGVHILSLLIDGDHRIWAGSSAGLLRWENGRALPTGKNAGFTAVTALAADATGAVWFVDADKGVFREEPGHEPTAVSDPAVQHGRITTVASGSGNSKASSTDIPQMTVCPVALFTDWLSDRTASFGSQPSAACVFRRAVVSLVAIRAAVCLAIAFFGRSQTPAETSGLATALAWLA
jgi:hypothetical protein